MGTSIAPSETGTYDFYSEGTGVWVFFFFFGGGGLGFRVFRV